MTRTLEYLWAQPVRLKLASAPAAHKKREVFMNDIAVSQQGAIKALFGLVKHLNESKTQD